MYKITVLFNDHYPLLVTFDKIDTDEQYSEVNHINHNKLSKFIANNIEWTSILSIDETVSALNKLTECIIYSTNLASKKLKNPNAKMLRENPG